MARAPEAPYMNRALVSPIIQAHCSVVLVQGAAGAGKTALAMNEPDLSRFSYVTLADPATFAEASQRPVEWAASLRKPVIIDDAHLLDGLPQAALQAASEASDAPDEGPAFVLMGSRAFPDLEGALCLTLFPLTRAELASREGSIVDALFDHVPCPRFRSSCTRSDLRTMMRTGGFPAYALRPACPDPHERSCQVRDRLRGLLGREEGRASDMDRLIGRAVLEKVMGEPGLFLNVEAAARACYVDADTFTAHLSAFAHRLAIHRLPNLARRPQARPFSGTRVYPVDTTLPVEALQTAGRDIALDPYGFGEVLRTFCVGQLAPAAQWSSEPTQCGHWRRFDRKVREIDLVLARQDRMVGVKVRNSAAVRNGELGALGRLAQDDRFARGFVIYLGQTIVQLADRIWALPVSALWEEGAFCPLG